MKTAAEQRITLHLRWRVWGGLIYQLPFLNLTSVLLPRFAWVFEKLYNVYIGRMNSVSYVTMQFEVYQ